MGRLKRFIEGEEVIVIINDDSHLPEDETVIRKNEVLPGNWESIEWVLKNFQYRYLVWESDKPEFEPLLMDVQTANLLMTAVNACKSTTQEKVKANIAKSRGWLAVYIRAAKEFIR